MRITVLTDRVGTSMARWANFPGRARRTGGTEMVFPLTRMPQSVWQPLDNPRVAWPRACYDTGALPFLIACPGKTPSTTAPSRTTGVPPTSTNLNPREGLAGAS